MKKIATDINDFEKIIEEGYLYVDKTEFLAKIINSGTYYFLSRPRRFGKSLFLDTIKRFYEGKKKLFQGLYIYDLDWDWPEHPIVYLDFNNIPAENRSVLEKSLQKRFKKIAADYEIELEIENAYYMFPSLIEKLAAKYERGVVVLIDEYDKAIISNLASNDQQQLEIARENQKYLKILYDNLKALMSELELVFITGISKFSKLSIFSTLNNLKELDMHPKFSHMLGYTEKELRDNFEPYFEKFAAAEGLSKAELYQQFKQMYNGFRFSDEEIRVYNPYSIARALEAEKIDNYWFESGTPSFLIELLRNDNQKIPQLADLEVFKSSLKAYDITSLQLVPLLFQTGYLTIKKIERNKIFHLSYPNQEVEQAFSQNILNEITDYGVKETLIARMQFALEDSNFEEFIAYLKSLFASIANLNIPGAPAERESYYHTIFYLVSELLADRELKIDSELLTSSGRIDMAVESLDKIMLIEFKANQSAKKAIEQIKEKNYVQRFKLKEKKIVLVGINFDTEKKNISEVEIEE